jgi:S1-C subfamily serine protease
MEAQSSGSGVIVSNDGKVLTNFHVIQQSPDSAPSESIYVALTDPNNPYLPLSQDNLFLAEVIEQNPSYDLVLLKIVAHANGTAHEQTMKFPFISIKNSASVNLMDEIFVISFPVKGGSTLTITSGKIIGRDDFEGWLKTDAMVLHGGSGGAVIDKKGKLIGIATKVLPDMQAVDTNNDGFPDMNVSIGSIGYVRPSRWFPAVNLPVEGAAPEVTVTTPIEVTGRVVASTTGNAVPHALIGLLKHGATEISQQTVLTYARADDLGNFKFVHPIPAGTYDIKIVAEGFNSMLLKDIKISKKNRYLTIKLQ